MNDNETITDIIAAMRDEGHTGESSCLEWVGAKMRYYADRLEAAQKREAITPKSNPDWKDICAKCKDGDILPEHCEYFGEPNGCNSPIYGEHPTAENSSVVGNAAKLREALDESRRIASDLGGCRLNDYWKLNEIVRVCEAALAEPVRNCDVGTAEEQDNRMVLYCKTRKCESCPLWDDLTNGVSCEFAWAQMPYEEGGAK